MDGRYTSDSRYTVEGYFGLVRDGLLDADEHVELLEGVIVAEPPQDPPHASGTMHVVEALRDAVGRRAILRVQMPFIAGPFSAPEPDVALVAGRVADYEERHPTQALLIVEVAQSSLPQDRLSKSRIYAAARVLEYWIVNLRGDCVEVFRRPDAEQRLYAERIIARRGDRIVLEAFPDSEVRVEDLLPAVRPTAR